MQKTNSINTIEFKNDSLHLIDQRVLPVDYKIFVCKTYKEVDYAIKTMVVRGAPAIGAAAAYGVCLAAQEFSHCSKAEFLIKLKEALELLNKSRPTAVNLMWAIKRMQRLIESSLQLEVAEICQKIKKEAAAILSEDIATNIKIGSIGQVLVSHGATILTHCNAGALATGGFGTALGVVRAAHYEGKRIFVYADETRPRLQGSKLTAWELKQEGIPVKVIADNVAATLIRDKKIDLILVGADRIALNGDTANKIGTFMLSVVAKVYKVPFYIVAPISTIDFEIQSGKEIVIEERDSEEVTHLGNIRLLPEGVEVYNPAFDVTPYENITGIITEKGIVTAPFMENLLKLKGEEG